MMDDMYYKWMGTVLGSIGSAANNYNPPMQQLAFACRHAMANPAPPDWANNMAYLIEQIVEMGQYLEHRGHHTLPVAKASYKLQKFILLCSKMPAHNIDRSVVSRHLRSMGLGQPAVDRFMLAYPER